MGSVAIPLAGMLEVEVPARQYGTSVGDWSAQLAGQPLGRPPLAWPFSCFLVTSG